jgi:hypothetical protein
MTNFFNLTREQHFTALFCDEKIGTQLDLDHPNTMLYQAAPELLGHHLAKNTGA